jgi:A/G-specific adenine glycosylase
MRAPDPATLLAWYDRHRRELPWRAAPDERMDPYRIWLSELMLQQTTVRSAGPYFARFLARFPDLRALASSPLEDVLSAWAGLGYYSRARNLHACAKAIIERYGGAFPRAEAELATLPGIGPYTAAAIAAIAFEERTVPVDGNVERVITRLYRIEAALPGAKPEIRRIAMQLAPSERHGDFAQALMDLGATICRPKQSAKREGRLRRGAAFVVLREDGAVLVRQREERGLLGGMTEVPGSNWSEDFANEAAIAEAPLPGRGPAWTWRRLDGDVRHVFTHFPLELTVYVAKARRDAKPPSDCRFLPSDAIVGAAFPTLMRKVLAHAGIPR